MGTAGFTWGDLRVIVRQSGHDSALRREMGQHWGDVEYLLAAVVDNLAMGNWQRQGKPGAKKPKPVPRPGVDDGTAHYGSEPILISDFNDWWGAEYG